MMQTGETYVGPPIDDAEQLAVLPEPLASVLRQVNGFVRYQGGLHVRGACIAPAWHALRVASIGPRAFHELYWDVRPSDIPFAEDCMGDQFLLRDDVVLRLSAETGGLESLAMGVVEFFSKAEDDPLEFLQMHPLMQFQAEGGRLAPGELLGAFPPFFVQQAGEGVSLRAIPTEERRGFLADVARQVRDMPDGGFIQFEIVPGATSRRTRG
jgi:hypothetical protein